MTLAINSRFPLGQLVITASARLELPAEAISMAICRHATGDWGDLPPDDRVANDNALSHGGRLFSAYGQGRAGFWIITEADGSVTTVLLPEDY